MLLPDHRGASHSDSSACCASGSERSKAGSKTASPRFWSGFQTEKESRCKSLMPRYSRPFSYASSCRKEDAERDEAVSVVERRM